MCALIVFAWCACVRLSLDHIINQYSLSVLMSLFRKRLTSFVVFANQHFFRLQFQMLNDNAAANNPNDSNLDIIFLAILKLKDNNPISRKSIKFLILEQNISKVF